MINKLQTHVEAIYRTRGPDIRPFLVDLSAIQEVLGPRVRPADEWVLVREQEDGIDLAVYIADAHLQALETVDGPREAVEGCFSAFCAATEGISHFLLLVERALRAEPVSRLELEVQAEVDKYVCAALHFPLRSQEWHARIFRDAELQEGMSPGERARYLEAGRLAEAFCTYLGGLPHPDAMLVELRAFWRGSGAQRMERLRKLAA